jgi:Tol biopolymer transport system component
VCAIAGPASGQVTSRVSVASGGTQGNLESYDASISANGRYVAFYSQSSSLVPGDTNSSNDAFVRDRVTRTTTRVSVDSSGVEGDLDSYSPALSADGRFVAYVSDATNLVSGDTNFRRDVFLHDRTAGATWRVSVGSNGAQADDMCYQPKLSANGRIVAFASDATNLVPGDTNGSRDVFVHDIVSGITTRASVSSTGAEAIGTSGSPSLSADGTKVAFESTAALVAGDTNGALDFFVRDLSNGTTVCVNVEPNGLPGGIFSPGNAVISGDGRFAGFMSASSNLVPGDTNIKSDVFVRDLAAGTTTRVSVDSNGSEGNSNSTYVSISFHGRFVAFGSFASNLVPNDANGMTKDIFLRDLSAGTTRLITANSLGVQSNDHSTAPVISLDGKHVVFQSVATNLVHGDTNDSMDIFVRDLP